MSYRTIIVDGSYLVRRPWEANGEAACVSASLGVLLDLAERSPEAKKIVVWEGPAGNSHQSGRAGRQVIDPGYKANRHPWDPALVDLAAELREVYRQIGWEQAWCEDEADDAAAALVEIESPRVLLWSADKDWLQLVSPEVDVQRDFARGSEAITAETIVERTGLTPKGWHDYLCLAGDTADGIPGVPKVADKRARDILRALPDVVDLILAGETVETGLARAAKTDASIVKWVAWCWDHDASVSEAHSLVTLRSASPLTRQGARIDLGEAADWCQRRGFSSAARRIASVQLSPDPWDDLPF